MNQLAVVLGYAAAYCALRGRPNAYGIAKWAGKIGWGAVAGWGAVWSGYSMYQGMFTMATAWLSNMNGHGAYFWMGSRVPDNTDGWLDWFVGTGRDYWTCFHAMAIIGAIRGNLIFMATGDWWAPYVCALLHPIAYSIPVWVRGDSDIERSELIFGSMLGGLMLLTKLI